MKSDARVARGDAGGLINEASILSEVVKVKWNDLQVAHFYNSVFSENSRPWRSQGGTGQPKTGSFGSGRPLGGIEFQGNGIINEAFV